MPRSPKNAQPSQKSRSRADETLEVERFFESKRAAAIYKHAILGSYVVPFASKTGSASSGNRVSIVDGYAGAGKYDDGEPGSPALIARAARGMPRRVLECTFVEKDQKTYEKLCAVLADEDGGSVRWRALHGTVQAHLDGILESAEGIPLFIFLDPFGLGLPFAVITDIFQRRPHGTSATEVLFRFDAGAIRRIRGVWHSQRENPARWATAAALDTAAGGSWWRDEDDRSMTNEQYVDWFMWTLLDKLCQQAGCSGWITEVWQRQDQQPVYYLVFLTRHREGISTFGEAMSLAAEKWRRAVFDEAIASATASGQSMLIEPDEMFDEQEKALVQQWEERIEQNLMSLLQKHEGFVVFQRYDEIFAGVLGLAREKHLRVVLKKLHASGVTASDSRGKLYEKRITRAARGVESGSAR
jgi:three-Cys-motif partner protein